MKFARQDHLESRMFRYIWRHSWRDQILILLLVLASLPIYFIGLDLPRTIVNEAIQGTAFQSADTRRTLQIDLPWSGHWWGEQITLFNGFDLERIPFLIVMSFLFLALVILNGLFKLRINTAKGRLGERLLRQLRLTLVSRILRFPLRHFRTAKAPELATMVKDEVEPLGGFIGDAYVQPVFLGGQAITALLFIMVQNIWLGLVAGGIALIQTILIPRMRAPILRLSRERQLVARSLAGRVGELVDGIAEIRSNRTFAFERAEVDGRLGRIFDIRFALFRKKFMVKFVNNLLSQLTPFLFFLVGGYFAIRGQLDVGQLLAVIVAYKELPGPMKELIDWDQRRLDTQMKYEQVISQFSPDDLLAEGTLTAPADTRLSGMFEIDDLTVLDAADTPLLDHVSLDLETDALVVFSGEGASALLNTLAGLESIDSGEIRLGGTSFSATSAMTARISHVAKSAYLSDGSVFDVLVYGLMRGTPGPDGWIHYQQAGTDGLHSLRARMLEIMRAVTLDEDLYRWGLLQPIGDGVDAARLLEARHAVAACLKRDGLDQLLEPFDPATYNHNASIAENLIFGVAAHPDFSPEVISNNPTLRHILRTEELEPRLLEIGSEIAAFMIEIFGGVSADNALIEQFSFVSGDELPEIKAILSRDTRSEADRTRLLHLALKYNESRHRLDLLTDADRTAFIRARNRFRIAVDTGHSGAISFYAPDAPTNGARLIDDILFGRIAEHKAKARPRIEAMIRTVLETEGLLPVVLEAGLAFRVGSGGRLISANQRQLLALARAILRKPDLLILDNALSGLSAEKQAHIIDNITAAHAPSGLYIASSANAFTLASARHIHFDGPRLVTDGETPASAMDVKEPVTWA